MSQLNNTSHNCYIMCRWQAVLTGPPGSVYEGYQFDTAIDIPNDYPLTPPKITFVTKVSLTYCVYF